MTCSKIEWNIYTIHVTSFSSIPYYINVRLISNMLSEQRSQFYILTLALLYWMVVQEWSKLVNKFEVPDISKKLLSLIYDQTVGRIGALEVLPITFRYIHCSCFVMMTKIIFFRKNSLFVVSLKTSDMLRKVKLEKSLRTKKWKNNQHGMDEQTVNYKHGNNEKNVRTTISSVVYFNKLLSAAY